MLALRQKSRQFHFDSAAQMLDFGSGYRCFVGGFVRLFGATIFFGTEDQRQSAPFIDCMDSLPFL
jgi:hypothetical protein